MARKRTYVFPRSEEFTTNEFLRLNCILVTEQSYPRINALIEQAGYERIITPRRFDVPTYERYGQSGGDKRWRRTERAARYVPIPQTEHKGRDGAAYSLRGPDGKIYSGRNAKQFVRENRQLFPGMEPGSVRIVISHLRTGRLKEHKGWTWHRSKRADGRGHWRKGKPRSTISESLYAQFRRALTADGLSARELARRVGRDATTVSRWIRGEDRPTEASVRDALARLSRRAA